MSAATSSPPLATKARVTHLERQLAEIDRDTIRRSAGISANALRDLLAKAKEMKAPLEKLLRDERKALRDRGE